MLRWWRRFQARRNATRLDRDIWSEVCADLGAPPLVVTPEFAWDVP